MSDFTTTEGILGSLEILAIPDEAVPLEAIVLVKALDENGVPSWYQRFTPDLSDFEAIGILSVALELVKTNCMDGYMCEYDDDADDDDDEAT